MIDRDASRLGHFAPAPINMEIRVLMQRDDDVLEKRTFARKKFSAEKCPRLKTGAHEFEVKNISEKGLCLANSKKVVLSGWISGTLIFSDDTAKKIDAIVVRNSDGEIGLHLVGPISVSPA